MLVMSVSLITNTWVQEKGWERIRGRLPRGYIWEMQEAEKRNKKGRAMGEMIMGRKERIEGEKERKEREEDGVIARKICLGGE